MCAKSVRWTLLHSLAITPTYTPVFEPAAARGSRVASSSARQAVCSSRRCCGSIAAASLGAMAKNSWSKASASLRKPALRVLDLPGPPSAS